MVWSELGDFARRDAAAAQWAACTAAAQEARKFDEASGASASRGGDATALAALWGLADALAL